MAGLTNGYGGPGGPGNNGNDGKPAQVTIKGTTSLQELIADASQDKINDTLSQEESYRELNVTKFFPDTFTADNSGSAPTGTLTSIRGVAGNFNIDASGYRAGGIFAGVGTPIARPGPN